MTDITPAAGWVVLDCDRNALAQDIRLVCNGDDAGCNHMFDHDGPVHKIVRLPAECGSAPFARIAAATVAENQSVPSHVVRRDGSAPQVHTIRIDDNFAAIDSAKLVPLPPFTLHRTDCRILLGSALLSSPCWRPTSLV